MIKFYVIHNYTLTRLNYINAQARPCHSMNVLVIIIVVEKYGAECIEISLSVLYKTSYIGRCWRLHRIVVQRVCRVGRFRFTDTHVTRRVALYI